MTFALLVALLSAPAFPQKGTVAGAVISSKEWKVTRAPTRVEEFIGDVRYRTAVDGISADWALYKHEQDLWQARGKVRVEHLLSGGDVVKAAGQKAYWDRKRGSGSLTGENGVDYSRSPADGTPPDEGRAGRIDWRGQEQITLDDGMHVWGPRLEAWADRGVYDRAARRLDLSGGRPVLRKFAGWEGGGALKDSPSGDWQGAVKGDSISAFEQERRLTADGRTEGWIVFPRSEGKR